jgi:hypothetical protein
MTAKNDEKHCHPERNRRRSEGSHRGIIALRSGYTMRFFIPLRSIQNDNEEAMKNTALHRMTTTTLPREKPQDHLIK